MFRSTVASRISDRGPTRGPAAPPDPPRPTGVLGTTAFGISPALDMPLGSEVRLAAGVEQLTPATLLGGAPPRFLRLSATGASALEELRGGRVSSPAGAALARRLVDAGLAEACPSVPPPPLTTTVVVPVRDRPDELGRCLRSLGQSHPVVVVDDCSTDPVAIAAVCREHGAELVRRTVPGGPAAARNAALPRVCSDLVAFVDSDCQVPEGWVARLLGHFSDPLVVAVAPRVVNGRSAGPRSPLDMGPRPATVSPGGAVPYVPSAAFVVRRAPLGDGFDASLRLGEDVDLVWRLHAAGWRIRYEPSVEVAHADPPTLGGRLRRRFAYGTSVGPLARRHPGDLDHLVLAPGPAVAVGAVVAMRPVVAALSAGAVVLSLARPLRRAGVSWSRIGRLSVLSLAHSWLGVGRWCGQFGWPMLAVVLAVRGKRSRWHRAARRTAACLLVLAPVLRDQVLGGERTLGWPATLVDGLLEQAAYGAGAVVGCQRERVLAPIVPSIRRSPGRAMG
jgi:mycofactocin system glycosyltransferase